MSDPREGVKPKDPSTAPTVTVEEAKSGRSTCRATGEKIEKGETRVGMEVYMGGRMSMSWQKALPFLKNCRAENCVRPSQNGTCRHTGHKFEKGEVRFTAMAGATQKVFLTFDAAAEVLQPVLDAVGDDAFKALEFQGLSDINAERRADFYRAFGIGKKDAAAFDKAHPPPAPGQEPKPPQRKRKQEGTDDKAGTPLGAAAAAASAPKSAASEQKESEEKETDASAADDEPPAKKKRGGRVAGGKAAGSRKAATAATEKANAEAADEDADEPLAKRKRGGKGIAAAEGRAPGGSKAKTAAGGKKAAAKKPSSKAAAADDTEEAAAVEEPESKAKRAPPRRAAARKAATKQKAAAEEEAEEEAGSGSDAEVKEADGEEVST